jgi:thymidine kinase
VQALRPCFALLASDSVRCVCVLPQRIYLGHVTSLNCTDTRPVLVGGAEIYEPVCRRCYLQKHVEPQVFEAAGAPLAR